MTRRHDTAIDYRNRLERVLRHVQLHLDGELSAGELARLASFSPFHFQRIFRALVGESVGEHVRRLRLERAAGALRRTDATVLALALEAGYGAHEPFTRAFKAHFGATPSEYREAAEAPPTPCAPTHVHWGPDDAVARFVPLVSEDPLESTEVETLAPLRVAAVRHVGPYSGVAAAFQRLMAWAGPRGVFGPATRVLAVYHDDPRSTDPDELRTDAAVTLPDGLELTDADPVELVELAGGEHAVGTFVGPYQRLGEAYQWLFGTWLARSGREPADRPVYEVYVSDPRTTPPEKAVTRICLPLA